MQGLGAVLGLRSTNELRERRRFRESSKDTCLGRFGRTTGDCNTGELSLAHPNMVLSADQMNEGMLGLQRMSRNPSSSFENSRGTIGVVLISPIDAGNAHSKGGLRSGTLVVKATSSSYGGAESLSGDDRGTAISPIGDVEKATEP